MYLEETIVDIHPGADILLVDAQPLIIPSLEPAVRVLRPAPAEDDRVPLAGYDLSKLELVNIHFFVLADVPEP